MSVNRGDHLCACIPEGTQNTELQNTGLDHPLQSKLGEKEWENTSNIQRQVDWI